MQFSDIKLTKYSHFAEMIKICHFFTVFTCRNLKFWSGSTVPSKN